MKLNHIGSEGSGDSTGNGIRMVTQVGFKAVQSVTEAGLQFGKRWTESDEQAGKAP